MVQESVRVTINIYPKFMLHLMTSRDSMYFLIAKTTAFCETLKIDLDFTIHDKQSHITCKLDHLSEVHVHPQFLGPRGPLRIPLISVPSVVRCPSCPVRNKNSRL